jgi:pimeloyl-ACP methyl ester carboxylesterase
MVAFEGRTVQSTKAEIYYEVYGDGPAILLVPGGEECPLHWWQNIPHFVRSGYRVLAMSLRGHWNSPCPPGYAHPRYFTDDALAILDNERIEQAAFICESLGGYVGTRMAVYHPERVAALVLMGSTGAIYSQENYATHHHALAFFEDAKKRSLPRPLPDFNRPGAEMRLLEHMLTMLSSPDGIWAMPLNMLEGMADKDIWIMPEDLGGYTVPTLVVGGDNDDFLGRGFQRHLVTLIPGAELSSLNDTGHNPYWEKPEECNAVCVEFLKRHGWG